jgi:hypothetical protein
MSLFQSAAKRKKTQENALITPSKRQVILVDFRHSEVNSPTPFTQSGEKISAFS